MAEAELKEKERLAVEERRRLLEELLRKEEARKKVEASHQAKEKPLPATHTVRRGETLLEISARADIYGEPQLWPLIYRANRDQIKDPKSLSAGQVLRIPRNVPRDELSEARRYAHEKPLF